jgi:hypothetical protein
VLTASPCGIFTIDCARDMVPEDGLKPCGDQSSARRSTPQSASLTARFLLLNEVRCCSIWSTSGVGNKYQSCGILDTRFWSTPLRQCRRFHLPVCLINYLRSPKTSPNDRDGRSEHIIPGHERGVADLIMHGRIVASLGSMRTG